MNEELKELKSIIIQCWNDGCSLAKCAAELSMYCEGDSSNWNYYYHFAQEEYEKIDKDFEEYIDNSGMVEIRS